MTVTSQIAVTQIIRQHDQEVRPRVLLRDRRPEGEERQQGDDRSERHGRFSSRKLWFLATWNLHRLMGTVYYLPAGPFLPGGFRRTHGSVPGDRPREGVGEVVGEKRLKGMLIFDGDYPMAYSALELNRDLTLPVEAVRRADPGSDNLVLATLPEMRRGGIAGALVKVVARIEREASPLWGYRSGDCSKGRSWPATRIAVLWSRGNGSSRTGSYERSSSGEE